MPNSGTTRRSLIATSAMLAPAIAIARAGRATTEGVAGPGAASVKPLIPPARGRMPVAFPISAGAVLIDIAGPWEVFLQASMIAPDGSMDMTGDRGFQPYTVAETKAPIAISGGMKLIPDFTFEDAPHPKLIVIPAQGGDSPAMLAWVAAEARQADVTMSICTGAFTLAKTGLLSGRAATTHHDAYSELAMLYPDIAVKRGYRFVDDGAIASSGGLTCGIDLAFHIVERYFGRPRALQTALAMEYQGRGWLDSTGADNAVYAKAAAGLTCPVCGMAVNPRTDPKADYKGRTYYFCSAAHQALFVSDPEKALRAAG